MSRLQALDPAQASGNGEIAEIVAHVALSALTNYLNRVAQTELDFPQAPALADEAA